MFIKIYYGYFFVIPNLYNILYILVLYFFINFADKWFQRKYVKIKITTLLLFLQSFSMFRKVVCR